MPIKPGKKTVIKASDSSKYIKLITQTNDDKEVMPFSNFGLYLHISKQEINN